MAQTTGTYSILDLLQVRDASAASYGVSTIAQAISADVSYTNQTVSELLSDLCQKTTSQISVWGGGQVHAMSKVDEFGEGLPTKFTPGINASIPLNRWVQKIQWSSKYFSMKTPEEIANEYLELRKGYLLAVQSEVKRAIYNNVNYTFVDRLFNNVSLSVKCFANADGGYDLPDSPGGATFTSSSHDHYPGEASFTEAFMDAAILNVTEHGNTKNLKIYINLNDLDQFNAVRVSGSTGAFTPLPDAASVLAINQLASGRTSDMSDLENRLVGYWKGNVEVWIKPWAIEHYYVVAATGMATKPLLFRELPYPALQGFRIDAPLPDYPLYADRTEAIFGIAPFDRTQVAVLYDGNATYAVPTIS